MIPLVEKFMSMKICSIASEKNVLEAAKKMAQHEIGSLLVTRSGSYIGVITEVDIVRKVIAKEMNPAALSVEKAMRSPLVTIEADETVMKANDLMETETVRHLAVTRGGEVVGILSVRDLLRPLYMEEEAGWFLGPPE